MQTEKNDIKRYKIRSPKCTSKFRFLQNFKAIDLESLKQDAGSLD